VLHKRGTLGRVGVDHRGSRGGGSTCSYTRTWARRNPCRRLHRTSRYRARADCGRPPRSSKTQSRHPHPTFSSLHTHTHTHTHTLITKEPSRRTSRDKICCTTERLHNGEAAPERKQVAGESRGAQKSAHTSPSPARTFFGDQPPSPALLEPRTVDQHFVRPGPWPRAYLNLRNF